MCVARSSSRSFLRFRLKSIEGTLGLRGGCTRFQWNEIITISFVLVEDEVLGFLDALDEFLD